MGLTDVFSKIMRNPLSGMSQLMEAQLTPEIMASWAIMIVLTGLGLSAFVWVLMKLFRR